MTLEQWLAKSSVQLSEAGVATARLDCLVLLEDITGKDRAWLLAHPEQQLESSKVEKLESWIERRSEHEPLSYIRGRSEFYGREFMVNEHTLEPRPETETMLELLLKLVKSGKLKVESIVDVGTGSGCLAITAKLELPTIDVLATDIDKKCIETAGRNAKKHDAEIAFYQGDLLLPIPKSVFQHPYSIVANLPYVPDSHQINQAAMHEPKLAIFGGEDGLDLYRNMFTQIDQLPTKPALILTESLPPQHQNLNEIATNSGYQLHKTEDLIQAFIPK